MIHSLPQSLIDTAEKHLQEAVALKTHVAMAKKASKSTTVGGISRAEQISGHVIPHGQDTTVIPLERDDVPAHPDVARHLNSVGYNVHDYKKGLAIKKGETKNPLSIGKVLERTNAPQHIKESYQKDPNRQGIDSSVHIVISRNPVHVAGMSTHQNWQSCQTLGGAGKDKDGNDLPRQSRGQEAQHVPEDIAAGSHIAYLVHNVNDVEEHHKPIARILLKPYHAESGHTILKPMKVYGDEWNGFHSSVHKWAEKHFEATEPEYKMNENVYPDGPAHIRDFSEKHDAYWSKKDPTLSGNWDLLIQHPSSKVIDAYQDHIGRSTGIDMYSGMLAQNKHLKDHHVMRIIDNPRIKDTTKETLVSNHKAALEYGLSKPELHHKVVTNPGLTKEHHNTLIDMHLPDFDNPPDDSDSRNKLGTIINGIANHPNLSEEQANRLIKSPRVTQYPGIMRGLYVKASDEHIIHALNSEKEEHDTNSWNYYDQAYANLMKNKPHLMHHMHPLMIYYGYNAIPRKENEHVEHEMLNNNPDHDDNFFHNVLASRSKNPSVLNRIMSETKNDSTKEKASGQLYRITHSDY